MTTLFKFDPCFDLLFDRCECVTFRRTKSGEEGEEWGSGKARMLTLLHDALLVAQGQRGQHTRSVRLQTLIRRLEAFSEEMALYTTEKEGFSVTGAHADPEQGLPISRNPAWYVRQTDT